MGTYSIIGIKFLEKQMQRSRNVTQKCSGKTETLYLENVFQQLDTSMYRTDANQTKRGKGYSMVSGGK